MNEKLVLIRLKKESEKTKQLRVYDEAFDIIENLVERTGQSKAAIASALIKFAVKYVEIQGEGEKSDE